jgi:8-oxo-dGTP pyrophosphatase MutT (NUDIX family)
VPDQRRALRDALLSPAQAAELDAHGTSDAAVLLPLYGWPERPGLVFTERNRDLPRHAGEISFPGGRRDPGDKDLIDTALREAQEEIALDRSTVDLVGALPPVGTFVTSYKVFPFVGLIPSGVELLPDPHEVESVLYLGLDELVGGYGKRRLVRRGVPFRTDTYIVDDHLIWGATARILGSLLERIGAQTSFSIGTATTLPHSVQDPS